MRRPGKNTRLFLPLFIVAVILMLAAPRTAKFGYNYRKGSAWKYETLFAQFDFPILKTREQIREERQNAESTVVPYYRYSSDVVNNSIKAVESMDLGPLGPLVSRELKSIFEKGVVSDEGVKQDSRHSESAVLYVQKDKRANKIPVAEVYKLSDARTRLYADLSASHGSDSLDQILRTAGVYDLVVPNLIFDEQTTSLVSTEAINKISPTLGYVSAGQVIVSNGEIITAELAQVLDSYRKEYEANVGYSGPVFLYWLGNLLVALMLVTLLGFEIFFSNKSIFNDSRYHYVLLVFTIASLLALIVVRLGDDWLFVVPFTITALYLQAFMRAKVIVPIYATSLLPLLIYSSKGVPLYVMFLLAGVIAIYFFNFFGKGWKQFIMALITFAVLAVTYMGFRFIDVLSGNAFHDLLRLLLASLLTVAVYPLIYLFERIFNLVSNSRLMELCDTSNPLLRELETKAPGTFQHSLQVMNLADAAARAIDANPLLLRAGALYHDIGKMRNPQCFVENESLLNKAVNEKYHSGLTAEQSAHDIIQHVSDGVALAQKHGIPSIVVDFIRTHHGTTRTGYFWHKFLADGGDASQEAAFRYPGPRPVTKEQVILMLCDSIEAASRTLTEYSPEAYSAFVEKMTEGKMAEGQFAEADISIKELGIIKEAIKSYLGNINHQRIAYPDRTPETVINSVFAGRNRNHIIKKNNRR